MSVNVWAAFCIGLVSLVIGFVAGLLWQADKPTPVARQEQLARHVVEPIERHTEPLLEAWVEGLDLDVLGKEG